MSRDCLLKDWLIVMRNEVSRDRNTAGLYIQKVKNMESKKIVICSSASFEKEIIEWKKKLGDIGFDVIKYPIRLQGDSCIRKRVFRALCFHSSC